MFTAAQNNSNTHGSIEHSDLIDDQASFGPYRGAGTIKEETDISLMDDKRNGSKRLLQS